MIYVRGYLIESGHDTLFLGGNGQGGEDAWYPML
jgi:hypothetical protein